MLPVGRNTVGVFGRVLAIVLVVAHREIEFPLGINFEVRIPKERPRVIALGIGQESLAGVGRNGIGRIHIRVVIDGGNASPAIHQIARGDESVGVQVIGAGNPREAPDLRRREAQLLALGLYVDELALAHIERPAQGSRDAAGKEPI